MAALNESTVELAALEYLRQLGWSTAFGPAIAPDSPGAQRCSYQYLYDRLRTAAARINPDLAPSVVEEAIKRLERAESQSVITENFRVHRLLTHGVPVEHRDDDGAVRTVRVQLIDFEGPGNNEWTWEHPPPNPPSTRRPDDQYSALRVYQDALRAWAEELINVLQDHLAENPLAWQRPTLPALRD